MKFERRFGPTHPLTHSDLVSTHFQLETKTENARFTGTIIYKQKEMTKHSMQAKIFS